MEVSDVPPALHHRLGQEATVGLLEFFETARQEWTPEVTTAAVVRFERRLGEEAGALRAEVGTLRADMREGFATLRGEMAAFRAEMREANAALRLETRDAIASLRQEYATNRLETRDAIASLRQEHATNRLEMLKWCVVFWVGQVFAVVGLVAVVLRLIVA